MFSGQLRNPQWRNWSVRVARLQNEVATKDLLMRHEFSHEQCSEIFPEIFDPLFFFIECFRGRRRGGGNFSSSLRFSGPFFCAAKWAFSTLKLAAPWRQPPEAPLDGSKRIPQNSCKISLPINQQKTKGQQLKGKIVSEFFTLFQNFFRRAFPFKTKGVSSMRTKEKKKIIKRIGQIDVAR